jgi:pyocin large subunit-like protein
MRRTGWFRGPLLIILWIIVVAFSGEQASGGNESGWRISRNEDVTEIAKSTRWSRPDTLIDHYRRHGADFEAKSAREYARMAHDFYRVAEEEGLPKKIAPDGTVRIYDRKTNTFGAYNPDGTTKTYFKPKNGERYWKRQQ